MFKKIINSLTSSIKNIINSVWDWFAEFSSDLIRLRRVSLINWVFMALIFVGIPLILLYLGSSYYKTEGMAGSNAVKKEVEILFFSADWCPHCTKAKPIVEDVKATFDGRTINNKTISFKYIDCTVETQDMKRNMEKYNVEGFPTIIIQSGDDITKYDGKVEKNELTTFIKNNM